MAKNNETTTKFKVDISELVKGMQTAKRQIALANAEFKSATAGMDDWSKSADGINAKLTQLDKTLVNQRKVLSNLEEQYELTVRQMGEGSKEAENLKIKIENQKASIAKTEKEFNRFSDTLKQVEKAEEQANKTGRDVVDVLNDMDKKAENAGDGFTVLKGAVATFAGNLATSAVSGIKNLAGNIMGLAESTREYRDTMSKLNSAGEDAGYGAEYAKDKYTDLYSVLGDETASSTAVSNFMAMNAEQSTLDSLLNSSIGIWAKYGDSIPLDGLAESVNETAKVGKITGNLADALNWAGISEDAFNEKLEKCTSEQERQRLIADTLNGTYGDLAKSYKENNKSVIEANKANANYTDKMAEMGARIEPVMTAIKQGFADIIAKILELTEGVDFSVIATGISEGFSYFIDTVIPAIMTGLGWIMDNKDTIIAGIVGIGAGFTAWKVVGLITGVTKAIKAMMLATEGATVAQKLFNLAQKANYIGLIISLIAGLVAGFIYLWNNCDEFREFWINLWEKIKTTVMNAWNEYLKPAFTAVGEAFKALWNNILKPYLKFMIDTYTKVFKGIKSLWDNVLKPAFQALGNFFVSLWNNYLKPYLQRIIENYKSVFNGIKSLWNDVLKPVFSAIGNTFKSIWNDWLKPTITKVKEGFQSMSDGVANIWSGLWGTIKGVINSILGGVEGMANGVVRGVNKVIDTLNNLSFEIPDWVPEFGGETFGFSIKKLAEVSIPKLAKGTIVDSPTLAMIGEAGKEVVMPLENNTGWLDDVASRIASKGGVAGSKAQTVNNNYNYEFNQTNNSPKPLDRLTIYRQTKNQFNYATGGAV